ncbi:MAG: cupin domain-containing protein [Bacteroidales bacterium]|nr:cupin domain-containing protein [Bacteroidales bacterium]
MIRRKEDAEVIIAENVAGGNAKIYKNMMVNASEMLGMGRMVARVVLPSGSSIGEHAHVDDAELYYILKGEATVTDNDKTEILHAGDAVFTGGGARHSIANMTSEDVEFLAVIIE